MIITTPSGPVNLDGTLIRSLLAAKPEVPPQPVKVSEMPADNGQIANNFELTTWPNNTDILYVDIKPATVDGEDLPWEFGAYSLTSGDHHWSHVTAISPNCQVRYRAVNPNGERIGPSLLVV